MSRSYKKPWIWVSKRFDKLKKRCWRSRNKQILHEISIDFDPDKDYIMFKEKEFGDWGTKCGWDVPPDDSRFEDYLKDTRK